MLMDVVYPKYQFAAKSAEEMLVRLVRLDNLHNYPFDEFHAHEYHELLVFIEGGGKHNINFTEYAIQNGSFHFLAAGDVHWVKRGVQSKGFALMFKDVFVMKLQEMNPQLNYFNFFGSSNVFHLPETEATSFSFILEELEKNTDNIPYSNNLVAAFLTKMAQTFENDIPPSSSNADHKIIIRLIELINKHYAEHLNATQYAASLNCSFNALDKKSRKLTGKSISELQQERILNEAKRQLFKENNCKEIAYDLGFSSESYFTNWFKKIVGCTPVKFRQGLISCLPLALFSEILPNIIC